MLHGNTRTLLVCASTTRVSEVPRGILSSLGSLHPGGRQVAYHFLCDCVFNFKQDRMQCVVISTQEWNFPYPDNMQSFSKF
ncbi:LOW QUALITY PROTEIN: hypothetical protein V1478_007289 [Vespula squamosa]|uniref:Uncharacterized protein n=1 Tax=Vespula squamosa TaxID=30214 RepID=A0ABD2B2Y0_VESSQ